MVSPPRAALPTLPKLRRLASPAAPDVQRRLARQAYDFVRHELRLTDQLAALLPICEEAAAAPPITQCASCIRRRMSSRCSPKK